MKSILILLLLVGVLNARFIGDDTKNVVLDTKTNLIWQDEEYTINENAVYNTNAEYGKALGWASAITYCENLTLGGFGDWYLPNFNELHGLVDKSIHDPALSNVFKGVVSSYYWSSTTGASSTSNAWLVHFDKGYGDDDDGYKIKSFYVRCVRLADN